VKLQKIECRTSLRAKYTIGFRIVNFWNSTPEEIVSASSVKFQGTF